MVSINDANALVLSCLYCMLNVENHEKTHLILYLNHEMSENSVTETMHLFLAIVQRFAKGDVGLNQVLNKSIASVQGKPIPLHTVTISHIPECAIQV